jgi:hypothetical protein
MPGRKIKENTEIKSDIQEKSDSERILEGQILVRAIIEMLGAPKEHIEKTMSDYIESLKQVKKYKIIKTFISEAVEQENKKDSPSEKLTHGAKLYSTFAELEIWFKDVEKLLEFCFDSLPSSIEIIEPETFKLRGSDFSGMLNDLQAKLHKLDMAFKMNNADKHAAAVTFTTLINNFIVYCLKTGKQTVEEITEVIGIDAEKLEKILDDLAEKKVIHKKGNNYSI